MFLLDHLSTAHRSGSVVPWPKPPATLGDDALLAKADPLVMADIAIEHGTEIVSFPMNNDDFP